MLDGVWNGSVGCMNPESPNLCDHSAPTPPPSCPLPVTQWGLPPWLHATVHPLAPAPTSALAATAAACLLCLGEWPYPQDSSITAGIDRFFSITSSGCVFYAKQT